MNEPSQTKCKFQSMRFKASDVLNLKAELDYQTVMQKLKKRTIPELKEVLAESRASSHFHNVFESVIPTITLMAIIPIMQAIPVKQFTNELYKMIVPIVIMAYIATAAIILILNFGKILKKNINFKGCFSCFFVMINSQGLDR